MPAPSQRPRPRLILALLLVVPVGLLTKVYTGPGQDWVQGYLGGTLYVIFWCLVGALAWPKATALRICGTVLLLTCLLEFSQLWHPIWLDQWRELFLVRTLIGSHFAWLDLPHYVAGAGLAWWGLRPR